MTIRLLVADDQSMIRAGFRMLLAREPDIDEYVYEALAGGASGFVLKDDPPEQLIAAIRTVARGDALLSPAVTRRVIRRFAQTRLPAAPKELGELTAREHEVLLLIAEGLSNAEIGASCTSARARSRPT